MKIINKVPESEYVWLSLLKGGDTFRFAQDGNCGTVYIKTATWLESRVVVRLADGLINYYGDIQVSPVALECKEV
jgi:hypothetical protein